MSRILIVKISSLGDILHSFPAVELLARERPETRIDWLVHPAFAAALRYCAAAPTPIPFPRKELSRFGSFIPAMKNTIASLRKEKYEAAIDLQGLIRSAFFARCSSAERAVGFRRPKESLAGIFYDVKYDIEPEYAHAVEKNARLVSRFLGTDLQILPPSPPVVPEFRENASKMLGDAGIAPETPFVSVAPGARWESKKWPPDFFAEIIRMALASGAGAKFAILGTAAESQDARKIMELLPAGTTVDFCGRTGMGELFEIIRMSRCIVANDSGPIHIAAALGTPAIAFFGPTIPARTGPYGKIHRVFTPTLNCIECLSTYCKEGHYKCHRGIEPGQVAEVVLELVKNQKQA